MKAPFKLLLETTKIIAIGIGVIVAMTQIMVERVLIKILKMLPLKTVVVKILIPITEPKLHRVELAVVVLIDIVGVMSV